MAGVVKRRGKWCVDFRDQDGKRRAKFFATRKEADEHLASVVPQVRRGAYRDPAALPTFAEVAARWLEQQRTHAPGTFENYEGQVRLHLLPAFGHLRIDQVTPEVIEDFRDRKWDKGRGLDRSTVNAMLARLGGTMGILPFAMRRGYLIHNPANRELVLRLRRERKAGKKGATAVQPTEVLTSEQAGQLIAAAAPGLYRTFFQAALLTGARSGELLGLTWDDINLDARTLRIERSLSWKPGETKGYGKAVAHFGPPKTDSSYRTLDLAPELVRALRAWKLQAPPSCVVIDEKDGTTGALVFPNLTGRPQHRAQLHKGLRAALDACPPSLQDGKPVPVPRVDLHGLRHTFASIAIGQLKLPPTQVAELLGHKDAGVTLEVYSHWFRGVSSKGAMADIAGAILNRSGDQMVTSPAGAAVTS